MDKRAEIDRLWEAVRAIEDRLRDLEGGDGHDDKTPCVGFEATGGEEDADE